MATKEFVYYFLSCSGTKLVKENEPDEIPQNFPRML